MKECEISAYCYSQKENVGIGFGVTFNSDEESIDTLDTEWIDIGVSESFWENHFEFEPGIEKAKLLIRSNPALSFRQALYIVFGDFSLSYEIGGEEINLNLELDINQAMYDMLEI